MIRGLNCKKFGFVGLILLLLVLTMFVLYSSSSLKTSQYFTEEDFSGRLLDNLAGSISSEASTSLVLTEKQDKSLFIDDTLFKKIKKIKVFCWITSQEKHLKSKVAAVNETWGRRCDGKIFIMTTKNVKPDIVDLNVADGRQHLTEKTIAAMKHLYKHYLNKYDWFLKADDDSYIIMENLKFLLSHYNYNEPIYLGHLFKKYSKWGYMSGGAGYVISREALRMLVEKGYSVKSKCSEKGADEDVELGHCLHAVGITVHDTRDRFDRETFHPFSSFVHYIGPVTKGLIAWDRHIPKAGPDCCSQLTISFHYTDPKMMRIMDFLLYRLSVYGRQTNFSAMKNFFKIGTVPPLTIH